MDWIEAWRAQWSPHSLGVAPVANAERKDALYRHLKGISADKDTGFTTAPPAGAGTFADVNTETYLG
jgi:hypothetical protein